MVGVGGCFVNLGLNGLKGWRTEDVVDAYSDGRTTETESKSMAGFAKSIGESHARYSLTGVGNGGVVEITAENDREFFILSQIFLYIIDHFGTFDGCIGYFAG